MSGRRFAGFLAPGVSSPQFVRALFAIWLLVSPLAGAQEGGQLAPERYSSAERFHVWNQGGFVRNLDFEPRWIDGDTLWYRRVDDSGTQFMLFEAGSGEHRPAFDHAHLARRLSSEFRRPIDSASLPLEDLSFSDDASELRFRFGKQLVMCVRDSLQCEYVPQSEPRTGELESPDGRWAAFRQGHDLWLRSLADGQLRRLTSDGEAHYGYGLAPGSSGSGMIGSMRSRAAATIPPIAIWSPDSRRILTSRLDERRVRKLTLVEAAPAGVLGPLAHTYRYAMPGDEFMPMAQLVIFEVDTGKRVDLKGSPIPATNGGPIEDDRVWWSEDGRAVYAVPREESQRRVQLIEWHAATGVPRTIMEEQGATYLDIGGNAEVRAVRTLQDGRVLWYSERDDWGHLYLYDRDGQLLEQLTRGPWKVMEVVRLDEDRNEVYFTAAGREPHGDPYQRRLYVVSLLGGKPRLLTPENGDHEFVATVSTAGTFSPSPPDPARASFSPSGRYFVDVYSRPDLPTHTIVRGRDGSLAGTLGEADISRLRAGGFTFPEPFEVLSSDGKEKLYGTLYRPRDFDPSRKYPVIDVVYPGPHIIVTPKTFEGALYGGYPLSSAQALAEVGFICVNIDGRGTPYRSKSFHDQSYGRWGDAGNLDDHLAAIRQLAIREPAMDLSRVGITGHSGGGFVAARALLEHPEFYKVAVSTSGAHDIRSYLPVWGSTYHGPHGSADYWQTANASLADRLQGNLLLIHGELDDNVHPAQSLQLVDALVKANKDFDLLILPGEDHTLRGVRGYVQRKRWDYFVRHLLDMEPPRGYRVAD